MAQNTLDLEQYFERDIVEFLDRQQAIQEKQDKNNSTEMLDALSANNIALAAKLIETSIINYNKIPLDSVYKEIQFKKIADMCQLAEEFIRMHPQPSKLREDILLIKKSGQLTQGSLERITVFNQIINEKEEAKIKAKDQEKEFAENLVEDMKKVSQEIIINIRKKELKLSINKYDKLKELFEQYPSSNIEQKHELYNDLLSFYMQITKLRKELEEENKKNAENRIKLELASKSNTDKYLRLRDIKEIVDFIKEDVKKSDFNTATQRIIELRQITSRIPDQYKHIRTILNSKIDVINQRIEFIKRINQHNKSTTPP